MADRKITVEVTDNKSLDGLLKKVDQLNTALAKTQALGNKVQVGGSVAAARALGSTGVPVGQKDEFGQYRTARSAVGTGAAGRDFARQAQGLGGLVHVYATFAANIFAVGAAFNALKKAMDFTIMQDSLNKLSSSIGTNLNTLTNSMVKATQGAIALGDAMKYVAMASTAGMSGKQIEQLTTAARGASAALGRDLADAMDRLFRGVVKMEPELLDELGIMTKANDAYKEYARSVNKSVEALSSVEKRMAFANAVIAEAEQKYSALAKTVDVNVYSKALAQLYNVSMEIGKALNTILGPIVNLFGESKALMTGFIVGITALLLSKAIPALTSWREGLKETAAQSDVAFKQMVQSARDSASASAQVFSRVIGAAQIKVGDEIKKARATALTALQEDVSSSFKSGKLLEDVKKATNIQAALVTLKERESVINNAIAKTTSQINNSSGNAKSHAQARLNALESMKLFMTQQHSLLKAITREEALLVELSKERALAEERANRSFKSNVQRKIDSAGDRAFRNSAIANVSNEASLYGVSSGFAQLGKEIDNFNDTKLKGEKLTAYENSMRKLGVATLATRGAITVLGAALMGFASVLMNVFAAVGAILLLFEGLAWISGGTSKTIEALSAANDNLKSTTENVAKTIEFNNVAMERGISIASQYVASQERIANAFTDLTDRLQESTVAGRAFANEAGTWWTSLKEGFFSIFSKDESSKFAENITKAAGALYSLSKGQAFNSDKQFYDIIKAAQQTKDMKELVRINEILLDLTERRGKIERANAESVRATSEFWKATVDEMRKHESTGQKIARIQKEVTESMNAQAKTITEANRDGNYVKAFSEIEAIASKIDVEQFKRIGGEAGAKFVQAFQDAIAASGKSIFDKLDLSKNFNDILTRAQESVTNPSKSAEFKSQANQSATKLAIEAANALTDIVNSSVSAEAKAKASENTAKFISDLYAAINSSLDPATIKKLLLDARSRGAEAAVTVGSDIPNQLTGKAQDIVTRARVTTTDNQWKTQEAQIKTLQEQANVERRLLDLDDRRLKSMVQQNRVIEDGVFEQYAEATKNAAETTYKIGIAQLELDKAKARSAGQYDSEAIAAFASRAELLRIEHSINVDIGEERSKQLKIDTRIAEIERDFKPLQSKLELISKMTDLLASSESLSTTETAVLKSQVSLRKSLLEADKEYQSRRVRAGDNQMELELNEREYAIKKEMIVIENTLTTEIAKRNAFENAINIAITSRETLLTNILNTTDSILSTGQALIEIEGQKTALAAQAATNYEKQVIALGNAATTQDKQRIALAAIADLQNKYLNLLEQQVTLWDRSGENVRAFEASLGLMIAKTAREAKGAGVIMAESLTSALNTGVDKIFDTLKEKGKLTFKELFSAVGKSFSDTILDGIKTNLKSDLASLMGNILGIENPEEVAKKEAAQQFENQVKLYKQQSEVINKNTLALLNLSKVLLANMEQVGPLNETLTGLKNTTEEQINSTQSLIQSNQTLYSGMMQAANMMMQSGNKTVGTIGKILNIAGRIFSGASSNGMQGAVDAASQGIGGPVGSLLSSGYQAYTGTSALGTFAGSYNAGVAAATGDYAISSGVGASIGEWAASTFGAELAGGIGSAMAGLASVMPYVAIAYALYSIFSKPGGGPKGGGSFMGSFSNTGQFVEDSSDPRFYTPNQSDAAAREVGMSIATGYADTMTRLGGRARALDVGIGWDTDPQGTAQSRTSTLVRDASGTVIYDAQNVEYGRGDSELQAGIQQEAQRAILAALQTSELPNEVANILDSVSAITGTKDEIDAVIKKAMDMADALKIVSGMNIIGFDITKLKEMVRGTETLTAAAQRIGAVFNVTARIADSAFGAIGIATYDMREALINAAGGIEGFMEKMSAFYSLYYTEGENFTYASSQLNASLNRLSLESIPRTKEQYRALMEAQDLTTEAGRAMYASLLNLAPAFDTIVGAIERTSQTIAQMNLDAQDRILLDTLNEKEKYDFWKHRAEELAAEASFSSLKSPEEVQRQYELAQNAAMQAWDQLDEGSRRLMLGDFQTFLRDLQDNADSRLLELANAATNSNLPITETPLPEETPADKLLAAVEISATKLSDAFTTGVDRLTLALQSVSTNKLVTDPSTLREIADRNSDLQNKERDDYILEQQQQRETQDAVHVAELAAVAASFREAAAMIMSGGKEINQAANSTLKIELSSTEEKSGHVNA